MRGRLATLAAVPLLALAACSAHAGATSSSGASSASVTVGAMSFSPTAVRIQAGGTVTWTWSGAGHGHDVRVSDGSVSPVQSDGSWSHTFSTAGTYRFHCDIHPMMTGTVVVDA